MWKVIFAVVACVLFAGNVDACGRGGGRFGGGKFLDRFRENHPRIFHRWNEDHKSDKKTDGKKACPECAPGKLGDKKGGVEELWLTPEGIEPELLRAPRSVQH